MSATRTNLTLATLALAAAMVASACGGSSGSGEPKTTASEPTTSHAASGSASNPAAPADTDLQSLLPTPANSKQTKGPDKIQDNGIHMYYRVEGSPRPVLDAYKAALEDKGWQVTTIVTSGGDSGGGGATYTGTNGETYGVFDGGGFETTTFLNVCTWPSKPANPNCNRGER